jgi:hypothetical protein
MVQIKHGLDWTDGLDIFSILDLHVSYVRWHGTKEYFITE